MLDLTLDKGKTVIFRSYSIIWSKTYEIMLRRGSEYFMKKNKHEVNVHHQYHVTGSGSYYCNLPVLDFHFRSLKINEKRRIFISSSSKILGRKTLNTIYRLHVFDSIVFLMLFFFY